MSPRQQYREGHAACARPVRVFAFLVSSFGHQLYHRQPAVAVADAITVNLHRPFSPLMTSRKAISNSSKYPSLTPSGLFPCRKCGAQTVKTRCILLSWALLNQVPHCTIVVPAALQVPYVVWLLTLRFGTLPEPRAVL